MAHFKRKRAPEVKSKKEMPLNKKQKKQVKAMVEKPMETKFAISAFGGTLTTTPTIYPVMTITQGDADANQRNGDTIFMKEFEVYEQFQKNTASTIAYENYRVIYFQWFPASVPTTSNILLNDPSISAISTQSFPNIDAKDEYHIIEDKVYSMVGNESTLTNAITPSLNVTRHKVLKIPRKKVQFQGASSTVMTDQFYCLMVADVTTTNGLAFKQNFRVEYLDP